jgi:hypothetical protein
LAENNKKPFEPQFTSLVEASRSNKIRRKANEELTAMLKSRRPDDGRRGEEDNSWKFPEDGVEVPLSIGFGNDETEVVTATGGGYTTSSPGKFPMVEFTVQQKKEGQLEAFLELFGHADTMWIKFKAGNEEPWTFPMDGSRGAMTAFSKCLAKLSSSRETQPYAAPKETQPWDAKATSKMGRDI